VPRWQGDANFMPILAGAVVMPELIPATYAKVRAETERSLLPAKLRSVAVVVLNRDSTHVLATNNHRLPSVAFKPSELIFTRATELVRSFGLEADLAGWAGDPSTRSPGRAAFAFLASPIAGVDAELRWIPVENAAENLRNGKDRTTLQRALNLDLSIASAPPG
jgi:hypothetical protein